MQDHAEIAKAMSKDPQHWATMFMEIREQLTTAMVELQSLKSKEEPVRGVFDSGRANSLLKLMNYMARLMGPAYMQEKEAKGSTSLFSLSSATCKDEDLVNIRDSADLILQMADDYLRLRGVFTDKELLHPQLKANNPCKIVFSNTRMYADDRGIVHYQTPVEGLAITLTAVAATMNEYSHPFTYRDFIRKWFYTDSDAETKIKRACREFSEPDAIVMRSISSTIALARALIVASFDEEADINYINTNYTLEAYVEASKRM